MEAGGINLQIIKDLLLIKALSGSASGEVTLKAGDIIKARVLAASDEDVVLSIGGSKIPATTNVNLRPGEMVSLVVAELGPDRIVLKQLSKQSLSAPPALKYTEEALVNYLLQDTGLKGDDLKSIATMLKGMRIDVGKELTELEQAIVEIGDQQGSAGSLVASDVLSDLDEIIISPADKEKVFAGIKAMIESVSHEANLVAYLEGADLDIDNFKSAVLKLHASIQSHAQTSMRHDLSSLKASVEKLLDVFSAIELLNTPVDSQQGQFIYLPLPVKVEGEVRTAEVKIYSKEQDGRAGSKQSNIFTIAFAMEMPSLGKTRAWLEIVDTFINFSIAIENKKALKEARDQFDELQRSLKELGYEVGRMAAIEMKEEPAKSLIEEKMGTRLEGIDFKA